MTIPSETEWVLVACGLIAHADGNLDGAEAERLLSLIDDRIPAEDYADALALIADQRALEARYAALPDPPADQHRALLEEVWTMAMVDGSRDTPELLILARLAERLGVEPVQLEFWREAWTRAEREFAERVAELAGYCLGAGEPLFEDDHSPFLDLVERLPASLEERERLATMAHATPSDGGVIGRALAATPRARRLEAFRLVAPLIRNSVDAEAAKERFSFVASAAGFFDIAVIER
ncbi:TerB family tellurite resistance protein [Pseudenhygromyxa sp. WMMC2535]|uniref:TerB family tellurite resistance protein n=1 Tax=Pseudenhygromyxa sp. WMMC2535 TaxID=2712867 RepID=UPI0015556F29|nr:TerB family tellurite resistance protein [Pseudenhygromyxa sp. WMMC2535]NVB43152.1 TerB family tellurite resistance protein [Pseudenhygromyxa sp. WMMC2535]